MIIVTSSSTRAGKIFPNDCNSYNWKCNFAHFRYLQMMFCILICRPRITNDGFSASYNSDPVPLEKSRGFQGNSFRRYSS